jgi:broad specificity phosphatase PhoE
LAHCRARPLHADDVKRLLLVLHAATSATRSAAFPADEPIEPGADAEAAPLGRLAARAEVEVVASPALRCAQTAAAAGLAPRVEPLIAECDFGAWAGRSLAEVDAADPDAVAAWMGDPAAAPHGGESLLAFAARVGGWLDAQAASDGTTLAITHGGVVKAALVHALGAPLDAFWRLDAAPLAITELHAHDGRWTITRTNCPLELVGRRAGAEVAGSETAPAVGGATRTEARA